MVQLGSLEATDRHKVNNTHSSPSRSSTKLCVQLSSHVVVGGRVVVVVVGGRVVVFACLSFFFPFLSLLGFLVAPGFFGSLLFFLSFFFFLSSSGALLTLPKTAGKIG